MSRRFMAAASQYQKRQQQQSQIGDTSSSHHHDRHSEAPLSLSARPAAVSPPASPSAVQRLATKASSRIANVHHHHRNDPNVSSMAIHDAHHHHHNSNTNSHGRRNGSTNTNSSTRSSPSQFAAARKKFLPSTGHAQEEEMKPEDGALQFLPAFRKNATLPGTSWDDHEDDGVNVVNAAAMNDEKKTADDDHEQAQEEDDLFDNFNNPHMAKSTTSQSMAFRARQYKHQRKQRGQPSPNNNANGNNNNSFATYNRSGSVVSSSQRSVASSILSSAAQALRSKSPGVLRPKSPLTMRPKSPSTLRPKSPMHNPTYATTNTSSSANNNRLRPKSPLASAASRGYQAHHSDESEEEQYARTPSHSQALERSRASQMDTSSNNHHDREQNANATNTTNASSKLGRVSRLASMFSGKASPTPQRPPATSSPRSSPYRRLAAGSSPTSSPQWRPNSPARNATNSSNINNNLRPVSPARNGLNNSYNSQGTVSPARNLRPVSPGRNGSSSNGMNNLRPASPARNMSSNTRSTNTALRPASPGRRSVTSASASEAPSSSTSSNYVGWPGTQDKRGKTVFAQSSNEESSSAGAPTQGSTFSWMTSPAMGQQQAMRKQSNSSSRSAIGGTASHGIAQSLLRRHQLRRPAPASSSNFVTPSPETRGPAEASGDPDYLSEALEASKAAMSSPERAKQQQSSLAQANNNFRAAPMASKAFALSSNNANTAWGLDGNQSDPPSSPSTAFSKTSSAYFNERDLNPLAYPDLQQPEDPSQQQSFNPFRGGRMTAAAAASVLRSQQGGAAPQAPTEENIAMNNHLTPPHRTFSGGAGFRGLLDKTKDVPCLMDDNSDSSRATSTTSHASKVDSDVFDGISSQEEQKSAKPKKALTEPHKFVRSNSRIKKAMYPEAIKEEEDFNPTSPRQRDKPNQPPEDYKLVLLGGGLTAIQPSMDHYAMRQTPDEFDETLSNSEVESNGYTRTPTVAEMIQAGQGLNDSAVLGSIPHSFPSPNNSSRNFSHNSSRETESLFSDPYNNSVVHQPTTDLAQYYIEPNVMKKLLRAYRYISERVAQRNMSLAELERLEDENKAFALFEMRSRIMEKDMERGLERRGGTVVVDDIALTPNNRVANLIRDAVIVAKAWRDGASPKDVINTSILTRRAERTYFIRRPILSMSSNNSILSGGYSSSSQRYYWEAVKWIDDTDFVLYHCPSLGPRNLRGFEMFTIGDCQSILLKLTNERCEELRKELNAATKDQLEAEELMREEGDDGFGMMTESEMAYLAAMEKVKIISKQLVVAEQSFNLVRDRIEKLIAKYENLLVKIDNEGSIAGASSVVTSTYDESVYSEDDLDSEAWEEREAQIWARRARRAELKAEVAAREALMAKQEADYVRQESQLELERVQQKLAELQSEASTAISNREHKLVLQNNLRQPQGPASQVGVGVDKSKINSVKQRFRDRMAAKKNQSSSSMNQTSSPPRPMGNGRYQSPSRSYGSPNKASSNNQMSQLFRQAGEEMFSHLDFYERSLKSIQN